MQTILIVRVVCDVNSAFACVKIAVFSRQSSYINKLFFTESATKNVTSDVTCKFASNVRMPVTQCPFLLAFQAHAHRCCLISSLVQCLGTMFHIDRRFAGSSLPRFSIQVPKFRVNLTQVTVFSSPLMK